MDDITANYHGGNELSVEANKKAQPAKERDRGKIVDLLMHEPTGMTCDEIEVRLNLKHQTASARLTELKRDGLVFVWGRRKTPTGSFAGVNILKAAVQGTLTFDLQST